MARSDFRSRIAPASLKLLVAEKLASIFSRFPEQNCSGLIEAVFNIGKGQWKTSDFRSRIAPASLKREDVRFCEKAREDFRSRIAPASLKREIVEGAYLASLDFRSRIAPASLKHDVYYSLAVHNS